jgi:putative colanic acid biosynthesis acetyltransferase WcaF
VPEAAGPERKSPGVQRLGHFRLPPGFRGRSALTVLAWQCVQASLFAWSPQPLYGWRRFLLRLFGAHIGPGVLVRPSARVTYPWKVEIGARSWIGDHAELYSLGPIRIGADSVISQRAYLCAATHDYRQPDFPILAPGVEIGDQAWIAADVFVAPGIRIGRGAVIGARSSVFRNIGDYELAMGSPARVTGRRPSSPAL